MLRALLDRFWVLLGVITLVFFLTALVPGDPVDVMLGERATGADREALRISLGLDKPIVERWSAYVLNVMQGDLGDSLLKQRSVIDLIQERLPATFQLAILSFAIVVIIAIPLGSYAARKHQQLGDHAATVFALLGQSIPNFWLGPMLVLLFSIYLAWLPISGNETWQHIILPAFTLGFSMTAIAVRMLRSSLLEILHQDWMRTARAKGGAESQVFWRHAVPNAMIPVLTLLSLQLGALLSGAVITEVVFGWPGIGSLLIDAIQQRDYPLIQGVVLVIAILYIVINLVTDMLLGWIDPRIEAQA